MNEELTKQVQRLEGSSDLFRNLIGLEILEADIGYCKGRLVIERHHMNPLGTVHGGCLYTIADTIGGVASATVGNPGPTISGDMYFMHTTGEAKELICEGRVIKNGTKIRVVESVITDENGVMMAKCILQYMDLQKNVLVNEAREVSEEFARICHYTPGEQVL